MGSPDARSTRGSPHLPKPGVNGSTAERLVLFSTRSPARVHDCAEPCVPPGFSLRLLRSRIFVLHRSQTKKRSVDFPVGSRTGPLMRILRFPDWVQLGQSGLPRSRKRGEEGSSIGRTICRRRVGTRPSSRRGGPLDSFHELTRCRIPHARSVARDRSRGRAHDRRRHLLTPAELIGAAAFRTSGYPATPGLLVLFLLAVVGLVAQLRRRRVESGQNLDF